MTRAFILLPLLASLTGAAFAHHGWGSYDATHPVTVTGPIMTTKFENPHATITVRGSDKVWTVTLAPVSRMSSRGATAKERRERLVRRRLVPPRCCWWHEGCVAG